MQPASDIEEHYKVPDPWAYQKSAADAKRKAIFIETLRRFGPYERLLDIGAGEGWLTKDYPVPVLHGYELSHLAAARFPAGVTRVTEPSGSYDIITATGIFYAHYDWPLFLDLIAKHGSRHVLVSSIASWEHDCVNQLGEEIYQQEFPYNEHEQRLRVFHLKR